MKTSSFVLAAAVIAMLAVSASAVQQLTGDDFDTATAEGAWFVKFYGMWERARVSCISVELCFQGFQVLLLLCSSEYFAFDYGLTLFFVATTWWWWWW